MLKPDQLRAMTPEDQTQLFDQLATAFYGTPNFVPRLTEDFGVGRATVFRWKRENNTPWAVLYALDRWVNTEAMVSNVFEDWQAVPAQLSVATRELARVAATLEKVARRLPGVRGGGQAS